MDPTAALSDMIDALDRHDYDVARECADWILSWLGKGGFPPTGCTPRETWCLCQEVLHHAEQLTPAETCIGE